MREERGSTLNQDSFSRLRYNDETSLSNKIYIYIYIYLYVCVFHSLKKRKETKAAQSLSLGQMKSYSPLAS